MLSAWPMLRKEPEPLPGVGRNHATTFTLLSDGDHTSGMHPPHRISAGADNSRITGVERDLEAIALRNDRAIAEIQPKQVCVIRTSFGTEITNRLKGSHGKLLSPVWSPMLSAARLGISPDPVIGARGQPPRPVGLAPFGRGHTCDTGIGAGGQTLCPVRMSFGQVSSISEHVDRVVSIGRGQAKLARILSEAGLVQFGRDNPLKTDQVRVRVPRPAPCDVSRHRRRCVETSETDFCAS